MSKDLSRERRRHNMSRNQGWSKFCRYLLQKVLESLNVLKFNQAKTVYSDWSKLSPDLLRKILESLNVLDFTRAKTICSDWYSVWRTCVKPRYPCQIILLKDGSSIVLDPKQNKFYNAEKLLGLDFSRESLCVATSGNWLLMRNYRLDYYLLNVLTRKRINLPSLESCIRGGQARFHRADNGSGYCLEPPHKTNPLKDRFISRNVSGVFVLSIDEETEDYFVAWLFKSHYLFTHKRGDNWWRNLNTKGTNLKIKDLAYRNEKLYLLTSKMHINILDFSRGLPKEVIEENPYHEHRFRNIWLHHAGEDVIWKMKIAIQNSGEVLIIRCMLQENKICFYVFKMNLESKIWERVHSIGDNEMLIFGHGVTIRTRVGDDNIKSDSIFFVDKQIGFVDNKINYLPNGNSYYCVFDLATSEITEYKSLGVSGITQCFVPRFA